jgi:hypothetical protein
MFSSYLHGPFRMPSEGTLSGDWPSCADMPSENGTYRLFPGPDLGITKIAFFWDTFPSETAVL